MALQRNISFVKGDSYAFVVTMTYNGAPLDITGRTYESQIRRVASADGPPNAQFTPVLTDPANGELTLYLYPADTNALNANVKYSWDLQQNDGGTITTLLIGSVVVVQDVTHP